jgi:hypothetical protein
MKALPLLGFPPSARKSKRADDEAVNQHVVGSSPTGGAKVLGGFRPSGRSPLCKRSGCSGVSACFGQFAAAKRDGGACCVSEAEQAA